MTENEVILMFLCGIAILQDSYEKLVRHGTWFDAMNNCISVQRYPLGLEQQNILQNEPFWIPKAFYQTQWIEHLGCSSKITETFTSQNDMTIGQCQYQCIMNNASYFSYKNRTCSCLQQLPTILTDSTDLCKHIVYQTLNNIHPTGNGDCIKTKCHDAQGSKYTKDDLTADSCERSYSILGICSDGSHQGNPPNNINHSTASVNCINRNTHLPGTNDSSCIKISQLGTGLASTYFWSSIFRTSYSMEADLKSTRPTNCSYGIISANATLIETIGDCNQDLPYICQHTHTTTSITNWSVSRKEHENIKATPHDATMTIANSFVSRKEEEETNATPLGLIFGVLVPSVLVLALLVAFVIIARKRKLMECKKFIKDKNTKVISNTNSINTSSCQPDEEKNCTDIQHVSGLIIHDEYAVITKTKIPQRAASHNDNNGLLYAATYGEYDRLNNSAAYKTQATHSEYDIANSNVLNGVYNVTVHHAGSKGTTDLYDHV